MPIVSLILSFIKKLIFKTFGEVVIDAIIENPKLRRRVFFFLAQHAVKWTDTDFDDRLLEEIRKANKVGSLDDEELTEAVGKRNMKKLKKIKEQF